MKRKLALTITVLVMLFSNFKINVTSAMFLPPPLPPPRLLSMAEMADMTLMANFSVRYFIERIREYIEERRPTFRPYFNVETEYNGGNIHELLLPPCNLIVRFIESARTENWNYNDNLALINEMKREMSRIWSSMGRCCDISVCRLINNSTGSHRIGHPIACSNAIGRDIINFELTQSGEIFVESYVRNQSSAWQVDTDGTVHVGPTSVTRIFIEIDDPRLRTIVPPSSSCTIL